MKYVAWICVFLTVTAVPLGLFSIGNSMGHYTGGDYLLGRMADALVLALAGCELGWW